MGERLEQRRGPHGRSDVVHSHDPRAGIERTHHRCEGRVISFGRCIAPPPDRSEKLLSRGTDEHRSVESGDDRTETSKQEKVVLDRLPEPDSGIRGDGGAGDPDRKSVV